MFRGGFLESGMDWKKFYESVAWRRRILPSLSMEQIIYLGGRGVEFGQPRKAPVMQREFCNQDIVEAVLETRNWEKQERRRQTDVLNS